MSTKKESSDTKDSYSNVLLKSCGLFASFSSEVEEVQANKLRVLKLND